MDWRDEVAEELERTRRLTLQLAEALSEDDLSRQVCDFLSPVVWDLGHIANFEELWLVRAVGDRELRPDRDGLYNAFENPRSARAELSLPSPAATLEYLREVRESALAVLSSVDSSRDDPLLSGGFVYRMVAQHEGQHQETILQGLDLPEAGWRGEAGKTESPRAATGDDPCNAQPGGAFGDETCVELNGGDPALDDEARVLVEGGPFTMGTADSSRAYDNEREPHEVEVAAFEIDRYPVTNRRWLAFMQDGGYRNPELWSEEGQRWLDGTGCRHPQGWTQRGDGSSAVVRFGTETELDPEEPVQHVCYWEAEAFARWGGGRLPTESEWEKAAAWDPEAGRARPLPWDDQIDEGAALGSMSGTGPAPIGRRPGLASPWGLEDLMQSTYNWTSSGFEPYPGFSAFPYREYSEVFFGGPYRVLRGASWATHRMLWRTTYRNWDLPQRRQLFAGVRVAYDLG